MTDDRSDEPMEGVAAASRVAPGDAFAILGNEKRIEILQALWEMHQPNQADGGVSFANLFEQVDIKDSGNFTYHLEKLSEHFVRQTTDGYELTQPGFRIVQTVLSGAVHEAPTLDRAEVDATCPLCDNQIAVSYDQGRDTMVIRCTECAGNWNRAWPEGTIFAFSMPPAGLRDRTPDEAFRAMLAWRIHRIETMVAGVCPVCAGTVDRSVTVCSEPHPADQGICQACGNHFRTVVRRVCTVCKESLRIPVAGEVLFHPAVIAFFYDHGVEHRVGTWAAIARAQDYEQTMLSSDPLRLQVTFPCGTDELQLTLDEDLTIVAITR